MKNFRNTIVDFQPSKCRQATLNSGAGTLTFSDGKVLTAITVSTGEKYFELEHSCTMFLNSGGDIRVTLLNNSKGFNNSVLFKSVQGDFHRLVKYIWIDDTTITDIILDERTFIKPL